VLRVCPQVATKAPLLLHYARQSRDAHQMETMASQRESQLDEADYRTAYQSAHTVVVKQGTRVADRKASSSPDRSAVDGNGRQLGLGPALAETPLALIRSTL
jgi:hypothetical protein